MWLQPGPGPVLPDGQLSKTRPGLVWTGPGQCFALILYTDLPNTPTTPHYTPPSPQKSPWSLAQNPKEVLDSDKHCDGEMTPIQGMEPKRYSILIVQMGTM